jgi:hypothetical protein
MQSCAAHPALPRWAEEVTTRWRGARAQEFPNNIRELDDMACWWNADAELTVIKSAQSCELPVIKSAQSCELPVTSYQPTAES